MPLPPKTPQQDQRDGWGTHTHVHRTRDTRSNKLGSHGSGGAVTHWQLIDIVVDLVTNGRFGPSETSTCTGAARGWPSTSVPPSWLSGLFKGKLVPDSDPTSKGAKHEQGGPPMNIAQLSAAPEPGGELH